MKNIDDLINDIFVFLFCLAILPSVLILYPFSFLSKERYLLWPRDMEWYWKPFCLLHWQLRDKVDGRDGMCPNCGVKKKDLIKEG